MSTLDCLSFDFPAFVKLSFTIGDLSIEFGVGIHHGHIQLTDKASWKLTLAASTAADNGLLLAKERALLLLLVVQVIQWKLSRTKVAFQKQLRMTGCMGR